MGSGTNPGAMMQEARFAESDADRLHKLRVARKEAGETRYWICVARDSGAYDEKTFRTQIDTVNPVIALLTRNIRKQGWRDGENTSRTRDHTNP